MAFMVFSSFLCLASAYIGRLGRGAPTEKYRVPTVSKEATLPPFSKRGGLTQECPGLPPGIVILAAVVTAATAITATTATTTGGGHQAVPATAAAEEENEDDDPPAATETIVITHKEPS